MSVLKIKDLKVLVGEREIVGGVNLEVKTGEVHVIMGPNGSGKSTMAYAIAGHPRYQIPSSSFHEIPSGNKNQVPKILIDGKDVTEMTVEERAREGIFLAFQNPVPIPGVGVSSVLRMVRNDKDFANFYEGLKTVAKGLSLKEEFLRRPLNEDFSGGEKKKMELLQATILEPKFIIFDEIDTGLDVDSLRLVGEKISELKKKCGIILITHYQRILRYVRADRVWVLRQGKIVASGGLELGLRIEKEGYGRL